MSQSRLASISPVTRASWAFAHPMQTTTLTTGGVNTTSQHASSPQHKNHLRQHCHRTCCSLHMDAACAVTCAQHVPYSIHACRGGHDCGCCRCLLLPPACAMPHAAQMMCRAAAHDKLQEHVRLLRFDGCHCYTYKRAAGHAHTQPPTTSACRCPPQGSFCIPSVWGYMRQRCGALHLSSAWMHLQ